MSFRPAEGRYERMPYRRCVRMGLKLPAISQGLWQNFGENARPDTARAISRSPSCSVPMMLCTRRSAGHSCVVRG